MKNLFSAIVVFFVFFTLSIPAFAVTIHVPADQPTIQAGIDAASDGDLVLVAAGMYYENISFLGKIVALESEAGAEVTTINGSRNGTVVTFGQGTNGASIDGFSIINGLSDQAYGYGGGIYCDVDTWQTIINCMTWNNEAEFGAGIFCDQNSSPTIVNCTIVDNRANAFGGGIYCFNDSNPLIENCLIAGNAGVFLGGGIFLDNDTTSVINGCRIFNNTADSGGGGIYINRQAQSVISECQINGNRAGLGGGLFIYEQSEVTLSDSQIFFNSASRGGGMQCDTTFAQISGCTFCYNTATAFHGLSGGGGIVFLLGAPVLSNSLIVGNYAADTGGGILCNWGAAPEIVNCTIAENEAGYGGGGLYSHSSFPLIVNTILWNNLAPFGVELGISFIFEEWPSSTITVNYSDVKGGAGSIFINPECPDCEIIWGDENVDTDPLFVGGGDYHLTAGSPCIDTGTDAGVYTDIDGDDRPFGIGFDMGADEYVPGLCFIGLII